MQATSRTQTKPIEIGSSSAIYDFDPALQEDSYDPAYLKADSQSQSQESLEVQPEAGKRTSAKATTSPICEAEDSSEDELPDAFEAVRQRKEKEQKAKALREKKAALLARQQEKAEQKKVEEDVKGKGREIVMDLDSDQDLEIEPTRAATPIIKSEHRSPRSHKLMRQLALRSAKKERNDEISDSQVHRAGRTFHGGEAQVVVAPHVATKASRATNSKKKESAVTAKAVYDLLLAKSRVQSHVEKVKRLEDWKRRGGTLRHDHAMEEAAAQGDEDEEGHDDRAKELMEAIKAGAENGGEEDEDDEDDDYIASDEEAALFSGEEVGSADEEEGSAGEDSEEEQGAPDKALKAQESYREKLTDANSDEPDMSADLSSIAPTEVIPSQGGLESGSESDDGIVAARRFKAVKSAILDDDDSQESFAEKPAKVTEDSSNESAQATQYHQFVVKGAAPAFPEVGEIKDISLTQAFGKVGATQAPPQASKAIFEDGEGFSQMFGSDGAEGFTQAAEPTQTGRQVENDAPLPSVCPCAILTP